VGVSDTRRQLLLGGRSWFLWSPPEAADVLAGEGVVLKCYEIASRGVRRRGIALPGKAKTLQLADDWSAVAGSPRWSTRVALSDIPPWTDQDIVLYHGTLDVNVASILNAVDLAQCRHLTDFGRGFYTTTNRQQAQRWAIGLELQSSTGVAAVVQFTLERNDLAALDCLFFVRGGPNAIDFWSFVQYCRTTTADHNRAHTQWYDIVVGPVTGSWKKQTVIPDGDQISFHTPRAAAVLDGSQKVQVA
jgi:hypothetical protein